MKMTARSGSSAKVASTRESATVAEGGRSYGSTVEGQRVSDIKAIKVKGLANKGKGLAKLYRSELATKVANATVMERVAFEVTGVPAELARDLFKSMQLPPAALYDLVGMPKSTLHRRLSMPNGLIDGMPGQTVVGYADLLNVLEGHLAEYGVQDTATDVEFNAGKWLGEWLQEPNPALGGALPADLMHAPSGRVAVTRALGGAFSGAYQ